MTANLPPQLLKFFTPRPPVPYLKPTDKDFSERPKVTFSGLGQVLALCKNHDLDYVPSETHEQKKARKAEEKAARAQALKDERAKAWDPAGDPNASGTDPYRTLFVGRLSYAVTESDLAKEFSYYGPVTRVHLVKEKKPAKNTMGESDEDEDAPPRLSRGYAFIEFAKEPDAVKAQRALDGTRLEGRRIVVDVERGRTVKGWKPRKLGGGLGDTRAPGKKPVPPSVMSNSGSQYDRRGSGQRDSMMGPDRPRFDRGGGRDYRDARPYDRGPPPRSGMGGARGDRDRGGYERGDRRPSYDQGPPSHRGDRDRDYRDGDRDRSRGDRHRYADGPPAYGRSEAPPSRPSSFEEQLKRGASEGYRGGERERRPDRSYDRPPPPRDRPRY